MHKDWVEKVSEVPKISQFEFTFSEKLSGYDQDIICRMVASNLISKISEDVTRECLETLSTFNNDPLDTILLRIIADQRVESSPEMLQTSSDNFIQLIEDIRDSIYKSSFNDIQAYDIGLFKSLAEDTFLMFPEVKIDNYYRTIESPLQLKYRHEAMGEVFKNYFSDKYVNKLTNVLIHCLIDEQKPIMVNIIKELTEKINQETSSESQYYIEQFEKLNEEAEFLTEITGIEHKVIIDQDGNPIEVKSIDAIREEEERQISKPKRIIDSKIQKSKKLKRKKIRKSRKRNRK